MSIRRWPYILFVVLNIPFKQHFFYNQPHTRYSKFQSFSCLLTSFLRWHFVIIAEALIQIQYAALFLSCDRWSFLMRPQRYNNIMVWQFYLSYVLLSLFILSLSCNSLTQYLKAMTSIVFGSISALMVLKTPCSWKQLFAVFTFTEIRKVCIEINKCSKPFTTEVEYFIRKCLGTESFRAKNVTGWKMSVGRKCFSVEMFGVEFFSIKV